MMTADLFTGPVAEALGWALVHFVWQAALIAALLAAALALLPRSRPSVRYVIACGALALLPLFFAATAWRSYEAPPAEMLTPAPAASTAATSVFAATAPVSATEPDGLAALSASAADYLPWIVLLWLAGVSCLSVRLVIAWTRTQNLARSGARPASTTWLRSFRRLSHALGVRRAIELLESTSIEVPTVIGWLKPVVLLPATALAGLTIEQVEMVLAHELAHIRRHDFFINLLQAAVETLMFYHPAVWWISNRVRVEREHCCDDLAIAVCGNPVQYARALTRLEELRGAGGLAMAANGGSLMDRIRRIVASPSEATAVPSRWAAAAAVVLVAAAIVAAPSLPVFAEHQTPQPQSVTPATPHVKPAPDGTPAETRIEVTPDTVDMDYDDSDVPEPPAIAGVPEPPIPTTPMAAIPELAAAAAAARVAPVAAAAALQAARPVIALAPLAAGMELPENLTDDMEKALADGIRGGIEGGIVGGIQGGIRGGVPTPPPDVRRTPRHREFGASGKLTVDELIELRATGVTPAYISEMRSAGLGDLTLGDVASLRAVGVSADYLHRLRQSGIEVHTANDARQLRAVGVTPDYISQIAAAGYHNLSPHDVAMLRATGVTPAFIKALTDAGYANLSAHDLTRLAASGVTTDFIRDMAQYRDKK